MRAVGCSPEGGLIYTIPVAILGALVMAALAWSTRLSGNAPAAMGWFSCSTCPSWL
jgi:hypothetical protein